MVSLGFTGPAGVCHEDGGEKGGGVSGQREWLGEVTAAPVQKAEAGDGDTGRLIFSCRARGSTALW